MSTISIIGSGGMATAISGRIAKAGHTVEVVSRDPAKARALADKLAAGRPQGSTAPHRRVTSSFSPCRTPVRRRW
jgi:8-hydroxy-5-deazaflavin:NADPH oxidoreductase